MKNLFQNLVLFIVCLMFVSVPAYEALSQQAEEPQTTVDPFGEVIHCTAGTKFNINEGFCAPVTDRRDEFDKLSSEFVGEVYDLRDMRVEYKGHYMPLNVDYIQEVLGEEVLQEILTKNLEKQFTQSGITSRVAGCSSCFGVGIQGTTYKNGFLQALNQAELQTEMIVHPNGLGSLSDGSGNCCIMYTTATNRTDSGVEVLVDYRKSNPTNGVFRIWDWSCSSLYPCTGGKTSPGFVHNVNLTSMSCNYTMKNDGGGHQHNLLYYANGTFKIDSGSPPLWKNEVWVWNSCTNGWDLKYTHQYRENQEDCATTGACGWWGPAIEPFFVTKPTIKEIGYKNSFLLHDGVWSWLQSGETNFAPISSPWNIFHLSPNRTWGVGNSTGN